MLTKKTVSADAANVAIAALRQLFATLGRPEVMDGIRSVRKQRHAPDILSGSEVERLLEATTDPKYRAILTLMYGAGLRIFAP